MDQQKSQILAPISIGELADKLTILWLKRRDFTGEKQVHAQHEYDLLLAVEEKFIPVDHPLYEKYLDLYNPLQDVNKQLWDVEDKIRELDKQLDFGENFIAEARSVYFLNNKRSVLKSRINKLFGSDIIEQKSYVD